jgi:hypothetical protein
MKTDNPDRRAEERTETRVGHAATHFDLQIPVPDPDAYWRCIERVVAEVGALPYVERIYVDSSRGLDFYTVYHGDLFDVGREMTEASGRAMDESPKVLVDFHFIPYTSVGLGSPSVTARQVFCR